MLIEFIDEREPEAIFFEMIGDACPRSGETVIVSEETGNTEWGVVKVEYLVNNPNHFDSYFPMSCAVAVTLRKKTIY